MNSLGPSDLALSMKKKLSYWYQQYELVLCINMFEPWERKLLHSLIMGTLVMMGYSCYVYLPSYMKSLMAKSISFIDHRLGEA